MADHEPDDWEAIAIDMMGLAEQLDSLINEADEDEDITVLVDTRNWLLDRACIFAPPGQPDGKYPKGEAQVFNLDAERARRGR